MIKGMKEKFKKSRTGTPAWIKNFSALLLVLMVAELAAFMLSYKNLNQSIQNERISAVRQISVLVSEKLILLREHYEHELKQSKEFLVNADISTLEEAEDVLMGAEDLYLLAEDGTCVSLKGEPIVFSSTDILQELRHSAEISSDICTVQTKGDFWIFSVPLPHVMIEGNAIAGLLKLVDLENYADITATAIFDGQGASYVVDENGVVLLRPSSSKANDYFNGYNLIQLLHRESVSDQLVRSLEQALENHTETEIIVPIQEHIWMIQSFPDDDRNIVMTIPISITAESTFAGMKHVIIMIATLILTLSVLFLIWVYYYVSREQKMKLENEKSAMKSDFMNKMSHDIRTPLNAIVGMHELALRSINNPSTVTDCLNKAKKSSEYLISIINDVLDMSRIESGKMQVSNTAFNMRELLDTVIQLETNPAKEKKLDLQLDCPSSIHADFLGDSIRIKQCLINLISNSIKFTPEHGTVSLTYEERGVDDSCSVVRFTVQDTGIGMSEAYMQRIFIPFEQEQSSFTSVYTGSGLGLSIVHNLVKLMKGTISVESKLNQGTKFVIELPLEKSDTPTENDSAEISELELSEILRGKRILLAEDNEINREIIIALLEEVGAVVDAAENGAIAAELFSGSSKGYYSIILMDIQMPVMNGLEAAKAIRNASHPDSKRIPIIALSANAFEEDIERSIQYGMQAHLTKPIDMDAINKVLIQYIR